MLKHFVKRGLCSLLVAGLLISMLCAFSMPRSSLYVGAYRAFLKAKDDACVSVTVDVGSGCGWLPEIGANSIIIYESSDNAYFKQVATYDAEDYPEMMGSGSTYYETPVIHEGREGYYYKAKVYCYAGDGINGDVRTYTTASVRATA